MTASDFDRAVEVMARAATPHIFALPRINLNKPAYELAYKRAEDALRALIPFLSEIGWKLVPVEATEDQMVAGNDAARRVQRGGSTGMTIDNQIRHQCAREAAAYTAMVTVAPNPLEGDHT